MQLDDAVMGSPLLPMAANLYIQHSEKVASEISEFRPNVWYHYENDVWPYGQENLHLFLQHLNNIHSNIKFTMEVE